MSDGATDLQAPQSHLQAMEQGMGDGEQPDGHLPFKVPEPGLEGAAALCSPGFQQSQELELPESQRHAPPECARYRGGLGVGDFTQLSPLQRVGLDSNEVLFVQHRGKLEGPPWYW